MSIKNIIDSKKDRPAREAASTLRSRNLEISELITREDRKIKTLKADLRSKRNVREALSDAYRNCEKAADSLEVFSEEREQMAGDFRFLFHSPLAFYLLGCLRLFGEEQRSRECLFNHVHTVASAHGGNINESDFSDLLKELLKRGFIKMVPGGAQTISLL